MRRGAVTNIRAGEGPWWSPPRPRRASWQPWCRPGSWSAQTPRGVPGAGLSALLPGCLAYAGRAWP